MLGIGVSLILTWLLLRYVVKQPVAIFGVAFTRQRFKEFVVGLAFMATIAVINFVWQAHFKDITYQINQNYGLVDLLAGSFWIFRGVLFEELLFRGVLLYLLIQRFGIFRACLFSSMIFGFHHWFSYEVFGERLVLMIYIFLVTGAGGWMFAFAFAKTKSLYAPIGLHLGWNLVSAIIFSSGPIGKQWLIQQGDPVQTGGWVTLLFFSLQTIIAPGLVTWYLQKRYKSANTSHLKN